MCYQSAIEYNTLVERGGGCRSCGRGGHAAGPRIGKLTKDIKKSSRRAKAAEWKQRNETLRECARDPSRAKQFWNVVFQKTAKDVHRAIELWANEQKSETTSDPVAVATTFRDNYERIGADTPPRGNTFCESARRRQDERVAEIARLPRHCRLRCGFAADALGLHDLVFRFSV